MRNFSKCTTSFTFKNVVCQNKPYFKSKDKGVVENIMNNLLLFLYLRNLKVTKLLKFQ